MDDIICLVIPTPELTKLNDLFVHEVMVPWMDKNLRDGWLICADFAVSTLIPPCYDYTEPEKNFQKLPFPLRRRCTRFEVYVASERDATAWRIFHEMGWRGIAKRAGWDLETRRPCAAVEPA